MEAAAFGTPGHLKSIHADLQLKWAAHSKRVEELWRSFTPSHREAVFRAGVSQGKILNDPHDQSLFQSYALYAEMNIRDISSSPRYFLDHFKYRATTNLIQQYNGGLKGGKGDCQLVRESVIVNNQILEQDFRNRFKRDFIAFRTRLRRSRASARRKTTARSGVCRRAL